MKKTPYEVTIEYLYRQLPMFQKVGSIAFKKGLGNIRQLTTHLGSPQDDFPSIHIAGTNGKGSVAHLLAAVFQANALKVGLYTSPHYRHFRERIKINGKFITEEAVVSFVTKHQDLIESINCSFFEITVALAFDYFAKKEVDIAIIETGLGGLYDSTNIVKPLLSIITNVSFDHQEMLGNSLPEIAVAKAGIIKPNTPVVVGETHPETKNLFLERAAELDAPIYFADQHYRVIPRSSNHTHTHYKVFYKDQLRHDPLIVNLTGDYQHLNLQTMLQSLDCVPTPFSVNPKTVAKGLSDVAKTTGFIGRWQVLAIQPMVIFDSAHNEAGIKAVSEQLKKLKFDRLHIILGMSAEKDPTKL